jgi:RNA polymerase sigma-70 factor, ECF subfamily
MQNDPIGSIERIIAEKRDASLVKTALAGDAKSFARLVSLYKNRIAALGMSFFKNTADTDDFVQDVFIKAYTNLAQYRGDALFSTWITRIAYNTAINAINRRKEYLPIADEDALYANGLTPEEAEIRRHTVEAVREAIKTLPARYALCLELYFFYDIPYEEISVITGYPVNTIKSHIFRAKKILRIKLRGLTNE